MGSYFSCYTGTLERPHELVAVKKDFAGLPCLLRRSLHFVVGAQALLSLMTEGTFSSGLHFGHRYVFFTIAKIII